MIVEVVAGSGSGGTIQVLAAGVTAITNGSSSVAVVYTSTLVSAEVPICTVINTTDASPIFLQPTITSYSTTGFTATFNAPADSGNYLLSYITGLIT